MWAFTNNKQTQTQQNHICFCVWWLTLLLSQIQSLVRWSHLFSSGCSLSLMSMLNSSSSENSRLSSFLTPSTLNFLLLLLLFFITPFSTQQPIRAPPSDGMGDVARWRGTTWSSPISVTKKASPLSPNFMCKFTGSPLISISTWGRKRDVRQVTLRSAVKRHEVHCSPLSLVISGRPSFRSARGRASRSEIRRAAVQQWHRCSRTAWRDSDLCRVPSPARTPARPTAPRNSWSESTWKTKKSHWWLHLCGLWRFEELW